MILIDDTEFEIPMYSEALLLNTKEFDEAQHPRDERGRFVSVNGVAVDGRIAGVGYVKRIQNEEVVAALNDAQGVEIPPSVHEAITRAMALIEKQSPVVAQVIREHAIVSARSDASDGAPMSTVWSIPSNPAYVSVNTGVSDEELSKQAHENPTFTIPSKMASREPPERFDEVMKLGAIVHEFGHVLDAASGGTLNQAFSRATYSHVNGKMSAGIDLVMKLSEYAVQAPAEAFAELFTADMMGYPVPPAYKDVVASYRKAEFFAKKSGGDPTASWSEDWQEWLHRETDGFIHIGSKDTTTKEYDEALHPRDDSGRWTDDSGAGGDVVSDGVSAAHRVEVATETAADRIKGEPVEYIVLIGPDGSEIATWTDNSRDSVKFRGGTDVRGTTLVHNHPSGSGLSIQDGVTATSRDLKEIRAITPGGVQFILRRDGDEWPEIEDLLFNAQDRVRNDFTKAIANGTMTVEQANVAHHHEVYTRVVKESNARTPERHITYRRAPSSNGSR